MTNVPVLYIIFNRLDTVTASFEAIRKVRPAKFYVAADGPRPERAGEAGRCQAVRDWVLAHIDWDCEVHTRFQDRNVGCGHHPADAITWLFENEEKGIILEDDCVASPSFFSFAGEMLDRYADHEAISIVCGSNFDKNGLCRAEDADYFFSRISYTWGWATWRRNWQDYDFTMKRWNKVSKRRLLRWLFDEPEYREYWRFIFDKTVREQPQDLWDYQFFFSCYDKRQMAIVPNVNLISNIGDGADATHTKASHEKMNTALADLAFPLRHPKRIIRNLAYDTLLQETCYGRVPFVPYWKKVKRRIKRILKG